MKITAFNGSPRKGWSTALLVEEALKGAAGAGAETKLIHLHDLDYQGCISCFSCKRLGGMSYGRCAVQDQLTPVLEAVNSCDGFILGSPIYFGSETGQMRQFIERLFFSNYRYSAEDKSLFGREIKTGLIYTMNITQEQIKEFGVDRTMAATARQLAMIFGPAQVLASTDTFQFDDYSKYDAPVFDPVAKARQREEVFPEDLKKAFRMGADLAAG